jgi:hypothetical protein
LKRLAFGMLRIHNPVDRAGVAGSLSSLPTANLTGFGTWEPAPIEPKRYGVAAALGSGQDLTLLRRSPWL